MLAQANVVPGGQTLDIAGEQILSKLLLVWLPEPLAVATLMLKSLIIYSVVEIGEGS
jgi:hypothetical protein